MKRLLNVTAVIEVGAGAGLMVAPSAMATLLVGAPLSSFAAESVARVGAAGLLALGVACRLASADEQSPAARGLVAAILLYNVGAVVVLGVAGIRLQPVGVALWPVVTLHAAMGSWCIRRVLEKRT